VGRFPWIEDTLDFLFFWSDVSAYHRRFDHV
jgi:hypothetical protein